MPHSAEQFDFLPQWCVPMHFRLLQKFTGLRVTMSTGILQSQNVFLLGSTISRGSYSKFSSRLYHALQSAANSVKIQKILRKKMRTVWQPSNRQTPNLQPTDCHKVVYVVTHFKCGGIFNDSSLHVYCWVWQWKNFENRSIFAGVMGNSVPGCFFYETRCRMERTHTQNNRKTFSINTVYTISFSAFTPSIEWQEGHSVCKKTLISNSNGSLEDYERTSLIRIVIFAKIG